MILDRVASPEQVGLSAARLQRIDAVVQTYMDRGLIAGAVTLVARNGQVGHLQGHGLQDVESNRPMQRDTLFRLASMTKPVISVAILMLLEEGKLLLNDPVSSYLPAFAGMQVAVPNARLAPGVASQLKTGEYHLEPAQREITIKDLLTHTSGLGSATVGLAFDAAQALLAAGTRGQTLREVVPRMAATPLSFQPGSAWEYSGAFAFDTLARIVEIISGLEIDEFLQQRVFEPLGMQDTDFYVPDLKMARLATVYARTPEGLRPGTTLGWMSSVEDPAHSYKSGGGGLVGTAEDYARFALMLANGGRAEGERVLSRKTVELMASNHVGQLPFDRVMNDMRGLRFGLGVRVVDDPAEATTLSSRGTFGWAGAYGTNSWIDPVEKMVGVLLIQRTPDLTDTELRGLWPRFQTAAYQAIDD